VAVISGGNVITGGVVMPNTGPRIYRGIGAPVAGTTYAGKVAVGDLYVDDANNNVYEYTEPVGTPTFTRIDTV
jgi:hypothetical protein